MHSSFQMNIYRSGNSADKLLHGWCHVKLLPYRPTFCVHHTRYNHALVYSVYYIRGEIRRMHVSLAVTGHLHFWLFCPGSSRATAVTRGWNGYRNKSQHRGLTLEKNILPAAPAMARTRDFSIRVWRSTTELFLLPMCTSSSASAVACALCGALS